MNKKRKKKYGSRVMSLVTLFAMLSVNLSFLAENVQAAAESNLYFSEVGVPGTPVTEKTVTAGDDFTLDVAIDPTSNQVSGAEIYVTFDHTKFSLTSITAPSAPEDCVATPAFSTILQSANIDNSAGSGSIALGVCMTTPASPIITSTSVATFAFHAINGTSGPLPISFSSETLATAIGETENVLVSMSGIDVTVNSIDNEAPILSAGSPSGTLSAGTTQATVSVTTSENATCKYDTSSGSYDSLSSTFTTTGALTHSFLVSGLVNGGSYGYFVRCKDANENSNQSDYLISFAVATPVIAPAISESHKDEKKKTPSRYVSNSKKKVARGATLIQRGKKFSKNNFVLIYFSKFGGGYYPPQKIKTSASGSFMIKYKVNKPKGRYGWYVVDMKTGKKSKTTYYTVK